MAFFDLESFQAQADLLRQRVLMYSLTLDRGFLAADEFYYAALDPLPNSEVTGAAVFGYDRDTNTLVTAVSARGLEPNVPHIQHIHGFANGQDAVQPTLAADADGDGYIENAEGGPLWGPVLLDMPTEVTPDGDMFFVQTTDLPAQGLGADPLLALRVYNIHGMSVPAGAGAGTPNEVNGTGGYKIGLVATGGEIERAETSGELRSFLGQTDFAELAREALRERILAGAGWIV